MKRRYSIEYTIQNDGGSSDDDDQDDKATYKFEWSIKVKYHDARKSYIKMYDAL